MVTIHLPVIYAGIVELMQICQNSNSSSFLTMKEAFILLEEIQNLIHHSALLNRPKTNLHDQSSSEAGSVDPQPYLYVRQFYGIAPMTTPISAMPSTSPLSYIFDCVASISVQCAGRLVEGTGSIGNLVEVLPRTLSLMHSLAAKLESPLSVAWDPSKWLASLLNLILLNLIII